MKKIAQTNEIFENVFAVNQAADEEPKSLRISIDSKAKVKIGNLSRGGKARSLEPIQADDHDTQWQTVLVGTRSSGSLWDSQYPQRPIVDLLWTICRNQRFHR